MGYENDPYRDEDGEPLMDFEDDINSDNDQPVQDQNLLDDNLDDEEEDDGWRQERSPTPVHDDSKSKPRKRLVKKSSALESGTDDFNLRDEDEGNFGVGEDDDLGGYLKDDSDGGGRSSSGGGGRKRKGIGKASDGSEKGKEKKRREGKGKGDKKFKVRKLGYSSAEKLRDPEGDREEMEMWNTVAGGDSEDDKEGNRTLDDDNFIDDTGVDPADRYGGENYPNSPGNAPQAEEAEEDEDIKQLFKIGKKKKRKEKSAGEIALLVENVMAELELAAEEDADLNRENKPAIVKLKKLPLLTDVLSKKQLQLEFLDHGVLKILKEWLEPLPDGSLPNINVRSAILKILTDFPIDLEQHDRREQLKKSNLGKVIMFFSKSDEETTSNRKLAKDLVDKWSRPIFNKSTRFEDMRSMEDERGAFRRPTVRRPINRDDGMESRDDDLDFPEASKRSKSGQSSDRQHASRPEALAMDFVVRPQSKIDPEQIRARAKQMVQDQRRLKMNKKLQQLKAPKKKQLQATKLSVEGRGMVKYL